MGVKGEFYHIDPRSDHSVPGVQRFSSPGEKSVHLRRRRFQVVQIQLQNRRRNREFQGTFRTRALRPILARWRIVRIRI